LVLVNQIAVGGFVSLGATMATSFWPSRPATWGVQNQP
jgi:hypothetical protein